MNFREKFMRFMQGRYGVDDLSKFMMGVAFFLVFVGFFVRSNILSVIVWLILILVYVRMFSKNGYKRYEENQKFLKVFGPVKTRVNKEINLLKLRKDYHIYTCPTCKQKIKIPRGKGKIAVKCPKCRTEFIKKS